MRERILLIEDDVEFLNLTQTWLQNAGYEILTAEDGVEVMRRVKKECPWDKAQTPESLRQYIMEEAYETIEAIDDKNWDELKKELGDLLLQIIFQAEIAEEENRFTLDSIIQHINEKLIERHPHVFSELRVNNADEVRDNWERIKVKKENRKSILEGLPKIMSALLLAQRIQDKE